MNVQSTFYAINPATGATLPHPHRAWDQTELDRALDAAADARAALRDAPRRQVATLLRSIAEHLDASRDVITRVMDEETALGLARCNFELDRTRVQAAAFAELVESSAYRAPTFDEGGTTYSAPDLRRLLQPLGTVAVFGASNFPLAFGVAGGDVVSALAARCPVVVKGHPGHPGTSALVADVVRSALRESGLPDGAHSSMVGGSLELSQALVADDRVDAVGFTGSFQGGMALAAVAAARPRPIPVYAEMGSLNPVVMTPESLRADPCTRAQQLADSVLSGWGQFCTRPGVILVPEGDADSLRAALVNAFASAAPHPMLTASLVARLDAEIEALKRQSSISVEQADRGRGLGFPATLITCSAAEFVTDSRLRAEFFGPVTCLVSVRDAEQTIECLRAIGGSLTGTLHASSPSDEWVATVWPVLEEQCGRLVYNGVPTGVSVSPAQQHGGPFPATNHPASTSVGLAAYERFMRPVAYQGVPDELLPSDLRLRPTEARAGGLDDSPGRLR
ncbi:aldehyde dehydrogenase (NADP(+)) [Nocardioides ginsengisoli]|uniref:Aldehyde dehydrogenase family protein n=1 Tax=Nocardioides ginsengisoli TaxID=363868 RepID=A0ABW3W4V9_9ACTN